MTLAIIIALSCLSELQQGNQVSVFVPEMLVRGRAVEVIQVDTTHQRATFVVEHVYSGGAELAGQRFTVAATQFSRKVSPIGVLLDARLKNGEVGIWVLDRDGTSRQLRGRIESPSDKDSLAYVCWRYRQQPVLPARRVIHSLYQPAGSIPLASYDAVRKWAEAVGKIHASGQDKRIRLLRELAKNGDLLIEPWAIRLLARNRAEGLDSFLEELAANDKLTIAGQVTADAVLAETNPKGWQKSKTRQKLMQSWVSGKLGDDLDAVQVKARFLEALAKKQLDVYDWLPLLTAWRTNQSWSGGFDWMLQSVGPLNELPPQERDKQQQYVVDFAVQQITQAKNHDLKQFGARWLFSIVLTDAQIATVRSLIKETDNEDLRDTPRVALETTERQKSITKHE
jgi:hypothetical protein